MSPLLPLAEKALMSGLLTRKATLMGISKLGLGLAALSGFFMLIALIYGSLAAYGLLLEYYAVPIAALIVAGSIFSLGLISGLSGFVLLKRKRKAALWQEGEIMALMDQFADFLGDDLVEPIKENPKTAVFLASVAGFLAGDHLH